MGNRYSWVLFTSENQLNAWNINRRRWRRNTSTSRSPIITGHLWWCHNANSEKPVLGDNGKVSDRQLFSQFVYSEHWIACDKLNLVSVTVNNEQYFSLGDSAMTFTCGFVTRTNPCESPDPWQKSLFTVAYTYSVYPYICLQAQKVYPSFPLAALSGKHIFVGLQPRWFTVFRMSSVAILSGLIMWFISEYIVMCHGRIKTIIRVYVGKKGDLLSIIAVVILTTDYVSVFDGWCVAYRMKYISDAQPKNVKIKMSG